MKYLYLLLNLSSFIIPIVYSFDKKMRFILQWKAVLLSLLSVAVVFIIWDVIFTVQGVWGFNSDYLVGINILHLPIEEWMFFIFIPFSSIFIHYALFYFYPQVKLSNALTSFITWGLVIIACALSALYSHRLYTFVNYGVFGLVLLLGLLNGKHLLSRFYLSFVIILIPFFIVNGILTGSFIENEVVWYNNQENLGFRLFTIPIEDVGYAFSMIFLNIYLIDKYRSYFKLPEFNTKN